MYWKRSTGYGWAEQPKLRAHPRLMRALVRILNTCVERCLPGLRGRFNARTARCHQREVFAHLIDDAERDVGERLYGLGPRLKLTKDPELSSAKSRQFVGNNRIGRSWALPSLLSGQVQRLIPDEIEARMASVR